MSHLVIEGVELIFELGRVSISVEQVMYKCAVGSSTTKNDSMRHKEVFYAS